MFCPNCRAEFQKGITHCPDCDIELVEQPVKEEKKESPEERKAYNRGVTILCRIILILGIGITAVTWALDLFFR